MKGPPEYARAARVVAPVRRSACRAAATPCPSAAPANVVAAFVGVLGLASAISANGVAVAPQALDFDIPVMMAVAAVCLPMFFTGRCLARWEGFVLLAYYAAYTAVLILKAAGNPWLAPLTFSLARGALPLTALVLAGETYHGLAKSPG